MTKVSKEELVRVAKISRLHVHEHDTLACMQQLEDVLSYVERIKEVGQDADIPSGKSVNVMREDTVTPADPAPLLEQAPQQEAHYFVVPRILSSNEE